MALSPPITEVSIAAERLGTAGVEPGPCDRAAAGPRQASVKTDAIDLETIKLLRCPPAFAPRRAFVTDSATVFLRKSTATTTIGLETSWTDTTHLRRAARTTGAPKARSEK
jgi:hypothetical protein